MGSLATRDAAAVGMPATGDASAAMGSSASPLLLAIQSPSIGSSLAKAMMDTVLAFARHGDPNAHSNPSLPLWPRYRASQLSTRACGWLCGLVVRMPRPG